MNKKHQKKALLLYGGWEGHTPEIFADWAQHELLGEFDVTCTQNLGVLNKESLTQYDLFLPIWTFGELSEEQQTALMDAVAGGLGMVAWHGNTSAFLESRPHKFLLGGQFVGHPGGNEIRYPVHFLDNDALVKGLDDCEVISEQYYLLIDPAVKILATTEINGAEYHWLKGVNMPVAWKRLWGAGRVFYCALGHTLDVLKEPSVKEMLKRAISWSAHFE